MTIPEGLKLSGDGELRVCVRCSKPFVFYAGGRYENAAKVCPTCLDRIQGRPSIVLERKEVGRWEGVEIQSLPGTWDIFDSEHHTDDACYKIDVKGEKYGASWSGRIVIYSKKEFGKGDLVDVREMFAVHKVQRVYTKQGNVYGTDLNTTIEDVPLNQEVEEGDRVRVERDARSERSYLVLEETESEKQYNLHFIQRRTKTTLKGYGSQYGYTVDDDCAVASWRISGGARSGRYHTDGVLAITTPEHPVLVTGRLEASGKDEVYS